jgi:hypothetical protein
MAFFFLQIQDQTRLSHSQWLCILNATINVSEKFTPPPLRETTQKLLEGGGGNFLPWFLPNKESVRTKIPAPRPRPSINLVTLQNRPKYFFLLNFTQRSTPYVDVHEIIIKVCSDINGCI